MESRHLAKIEELLFEAYQIAGQMSAKIPGKKATNEQEIRLMDILGCKILDLLYEIE